MRCCCCQCEKRFRFGFRFRLFRIPHSFSCANPHACPSGFLMLLQGERGGEHDWNFQVRARARVHVRACARSRSCVRECVFSARQVIPYIETGTRPFLCPTAIPVHNECYMVRNGTAPQRLRHDIPHAPTQQAPRDCAQVHVCDVSSIACCSIFSPPLQALGRPLITPRSAQRVRAAAAGASALTAVDSLRRRRFFLEGWAGIRRTCCPSRHAGWIWRAWRPCSSHFRSGTHREHPKLARIMLS